MELVKSVRPLEIIYDPANYMFCFRMVVTRHKAGGSRFGSGLGSASGSGTGSEPVDDGLREFIASEITRGILEAIPVIFGSIKEGIIELMEEHLRAF